jgi:hypothetical protein
LHGIQFWRFGELQILRSRKASAHAA